jgi:hypothetical protein
MLTLKQATALVDAYAPGAGAAWVPGATTVERPTCWFFPVGFIGSVGVVVDKVTGKLTPLGSAYSLDDWLWGYEAGFLVAPVTLRVTSVVELEPTLHVLQSCVRGEFRWRYELRSWLKERLQSLPAEFPEQDLQMAFPSFRAASQSGWFTYELLVGVMDQISRSAADQREDDKRDR